MPKIEDLEDTLKLMETRVTQPITVGRCVRRHTVESLHNLTLCTQPRGVRQQRLLKYLVTRNQDTSYHALCIRISQIRENVGLLTWWITQRFLHTFEGPREHQTNIHSNRHTNIHTYSTVIDQLHTYYWPWMR